MDNLSLIIPLYNEANRLNDSLKIIKKFLSKKKNSEVIFVNDGSNDQSDKIIKNFISKFKKKELIKYVYYKKLKIIYKLIIMKKFKKSTYFVSDWFKISENISALYVWDPYFIKA